MTLLLAASQTTAAQTHKSVQHYGVLREIMRELKLEANVDLADLEGGTVLFALGALEGLSGELMILNGKAYKTSITETGKMITDHELEGGASLLVAASVQEWTEVEITKGLENMADLEAELKRLAIQHDVNVNKPFPFMITGKFQYIKSHVINAPGASEQSHEAFKQSGVVNELREEEGIILGFYSEQHQTVFTHHDSYIHAHILSGEPATAAHVDELSLSPGIILKLPKTW